LLPLQTETEAVSCAKMSSILVYYAALKGIRAEEAPAQATPAKTSGKGSSSQPPASASNDVDKLKAKIASLEGKVRQLIEQIGGDAAQPKGKGKGKRKGRKQIDLKTPKGTQDYGPDAMAVREWVFKKITAVFKKHGAQTIDTPVFELKELLTNKYGEDSKLIYDLKDQGGEMCALRYDLTVPFARYLAMRREKNLKRYHIGRVYRRDQPSKAQGRLREFYQCDFDIAGNFGGNMLPDAEVVCVASEALTDLEVGEFVIKVNHRQMLDGVFSVCGVPKNLFNPICSAVDKLDKIPWEEVKAEMITKTLAPEKCDKLWEYVQLKSEPGSPDQLLEKLEADAVLMKNKSAAAAVKDLKLLFTYLTSMGKATRVSLDLSLARGLDYYTGVIFEAVQTGASNVLQVGSIAGGGRYDNLVGSLGGEKIPCIGFSLGIERIFVIVDSIQQKKEAKDRLRELDVDVVICPIGKFAEERMQLASMLWDANIKVLVPMKTKLRPGDVLGSASDDHIPFAVIFGSDELKRKAVKIKNLETQEERECPMDELVSTMLKNLGRG